MTPKKPNREYSGSWALVVQGGNGLPTLSKKKKWFVTGVFEKTRIRD
jgi:hypothetical protein